MKKKKSPKKIITFIPLLRKYKNLLLILGSIFCFIIIGLVIKMQLRPAKEGIHNDLKTIPHDVKMPMVATSSATFRIPILMYHYVEYVQDKKDTIRQSLNVNPNVFDSQMKTLRDAGYTFITASELADVIDGKKQLPPHPILITIDDGHWDLDTEILPILKKYNIQATAYIISGFIGGSDFLSSEQLQDVINSKLVEIGAHTVHHIALAGKLAPLVFYEVSQSKKDLEQTYHLHVVSFAYPSGSFDQQAIDAVKQVGFRTAVSTIPGIAQNNGNRFFLYRIRPGYRTGHDLLSFLSQASFKPW